MLTVPRTFDCNEAGRFVITIWLNIDPSYAGFNRLYFVLDNGRFCISNYVEFLSDNSEDQQLEWGGSLPTGDYKIRGRMKNIQLNSTCPDSVREVCYKDLGWIHITEFSNPEKVMEIEYFCQTSYNVFSSPNTEEYIDIAFNIANTRDSVITYWTDLPCSLILNTTQAISEYIYAYKQFDDRMFLCGIKGFRDAQGNLIITKLGTTILTDTISFTPSCYSGSFVAIKACINNAAMQRYKVDYNDFVAATTIHELGHQRAILHHEGHSSKFCIMNMELIIDNYVCRYENPHFCENCIIKLKNINW